MRHDAPAAYWLQEGELVRGLPEDAFPFLDERGHVISLVGGGGKTTLMYYLASCYARRGMRAAVMTTTKIGRPAQWCADMNDCRAAWQQGRVAVCGSLRENGALGAPDFLEELLAQADALIIEADGARRMPCKAPAAHEPVILPQTDTVIAVMGADALGQRIDACCLRAQIVTQLLGCGEDHALTGRDMAALLLSDKGSRKGVGDRDFYVVLNKCDNEARVAGGRRLLELLLAKGHKRAVLTCGMPRSETYEPHP